MSAPDRLPHIPGPFRCLRIVRDLVWPLLPGVLAGALLLAVAARGTRVSTPPPETRTPALVSVTQALLAPPYCRSSPRGQLQADLRTLAHMVRYVLTPEPPADVRGSAAIA